MIVSRKRNRLLVTVILVLVAGTVGCVWWVYTLPPSQRDRAVQLGAFVLTLVFTGLVPAVGWLWRARHLSGLRPVDTLADLLAQGVYGQWRRAATERVLLRPAPIPVRWSLSSLPVAGELTAALDGPFSPLPSLTAQHGHEHMRESTQVTERQLRAGGGRWELFAVYAGLASGRMVVVGAPGSGKTGSAVLLVLDALEHREQVDDAERARVPVPVLFTVHGWDPVTCSIGDWLAAQLAATYPLFQHRSGQAEAAALVAAGAVALILDGLDEMHEATRPAALQALSDAPFRVVVLTRSQEMVQAAGDAWLVGAVAIHVHDVAGAEGADYLQRARTGPPPSGWSQLLTHLREHSDSVLAHGLSTPLALSLIRDTYGAGDDISELLDASRYRTPEHIEQHLISRVLPEAYTPRPGRPPPRYNLVQATQALAFIAQQMNHHRTRDFAWWHIPRWAPATPRILASILASGLLGALASWLIAWLVHGFGWYNLFNLGFGLGLGILLGLAHGRGGSEPKRIRNWQAVSFRSLLFRGFAYMLVFGTAAWLIGLITGAAYRLAFGLKSNPPDIMAGFIIGLIAVLSLGLKRESKGVTVTGGSGSPRTLKSWRTGGAIVLVTGLLAGLMVGLAGELREGLGDGLGIGLMFGSVCGLVFAAAYGLLRWLATRSVVVLVEGESRPLGPRESWRNDRILGVVSGLMAGLATMAGYWFYVIVVQLTTRPRGVIPRIDFMHGLANGLAFGIVMVFVFGITSSMAWPTIIAWLQLQRSRHIPSIPLIAFLEDARDRGALRTVGAAYQFRHATLQHQLADQTRKPNPATSSSADY